MSLGPDGFGGAARRLMGHAALLLGWRPADFWAATPAELAAILETMAEGTGAGARGMDAGELARVQEIWRDDG